MGRHDDNSSLDDDGRRKPTKKSKKHRRKRRDDESSVISAQGGDRHEEQQKRSKNKKKRRHVEDDSSSQHRRRRKRKRKDGDDDDSSLSERRHHCSSRKERTKQTKKKKDKKKTRRREDGENDSNYSSSLDRNYALADALCSAFERHPALVEDLPLLLIRMAGGTTFDLSGSPVASSLAAVFGCLQPFGVLCESGSWMWKNPAAATAAAAAGRNSSSSSNRNKKNANSELVLIRLMRAMLDQIGMTIDAIGRFENPPAVEIIQKRAAVANDGAPSNELLLVEKQAIELLQQYRESGDLAKELAGICGMILEGESIALDGLPDEKLRTALESLFTACALEKSEMGQDDGESDGDDDNKGEPAMGYALPESNHEVAKSLLLSVLQACDSKPVARRVIKGPMMNPEDYNGQHYDEPQQEAEGESSDDEGPLPVGGANTKASTLSNEVVKAQAARRAKELACAKHGVDAGPDDGNAREEWMLVPGKFDFLSAIKSGQPIRSRTFLAKSKAEEESAAAAVDPETRAEILAIRRAHEEARGPSLMEQHREAKKAEAAAAKNARKGGKESWKWERDKDLDAGRRVDKDALGMIMGGAGSDLKNKFQSSL